MSVSDKAARADIVVRQGMGRQAVGGTWQNVRMSTSRISWKISDMYCRQHNTTKKHGSGDKGRQVRSVERLAMKEGRGVLPSSSYPHVADADHGLPYRTQAKAEVSFCFATWSDF